jgi:glutamate/aspartate transport system substrate-binding protein
MRMAQHLGVLALLLSPLPAAADALPDTLSKIAQSKTITIGYREAAAPFSYQQPDGSVIGYSIDLCLEIAKAVQKKLGLDSLKVDYVASSAATRFVLVKSGKVDLECTTTTNTRERRQLVDFAYPHFLTATRFVSLKRNHIDNITDLAGRSVVSTTGTVNVEQLNSINRNLSLNIQVMLAKQHAEAFALVESGKAYAFVMDGILLADLIASSKHPEDFALSTDTFGPAEPYGIMLPRGDAAFKDVVDGTLRQIFTSDEIKTLYAKWFLTPIAPDGRNLNLPMSPIIEAAFRAPEEYQQ